MLKRDLEKIYIESGDEIHIPTTKTIHYLNLQKNSPETSSPMHLNNLKTLNINPRREYFLSSQPYNRELPLPPAKEKLISIDTSKDENFNGNPIRQSYISAKNVKNDIKNSISELTRLNNKLAIGGQTNEIARCNFHKSVPDDKEVSNPNTKIKAELINGRLESPITISSKFQENSNLNQIDIKRKKKDLPNIAKDENSLINTRIEKIDENITQNIPPKILEKVNPENPLKKVNSQTLKKNNINISRGSDDNKAEKSKSKETSINEMKDKKAKRSASKPLGSDLYNSEMEKNKNNEKSLKKKKISHTRASTSNDYDNSEMAGKIEKVISHKPRKSQSKVSKTNDSDSSKMEGEKRHETKPKKNKIIAFKFPKLKDSEKCETSRKKIDMRKQTTISNEISKPSDHDNFNNFEVMKSLKIQTMTLTQKLKMSEDRESFRNICRPKTNNDSEFKTNSKFNSSTKSNKSDSHSSFKSRQSTALNSYNDPESNIQSLRKLNPDKIKQIKQLSRQFDSSEKSDLKYFKLDEKNKKVSSENLFQNGNGFKLLNSKLDNLQGSRRGKSFVKTTLSTMDHSTFLNGQIIPNKNVHDTENNNIIPQKTPPYGNSSTLSMRKKDYNSAR